MKKTKLVVLIIILILFGFYITYDNPKMKPNNISTPIEDSMAWLENEDSRSDELIPVEYRGEKEWAPVEVVECIKNDDGIFQITFVNGYFIDSETPSKIGDTNRCWVNTWYYPKKYPTSDSLVFKNPYKTNSITIKNPINK